MVIETSSSYKNLLQKIAGKSVPAVFVRDDNRNHPAESSVIAVSLFVDEEILLKESRQACADLFNRAGVTI